MFSFICCSFRVKQDLPTSFLHFRHRSSRTARSRRTASVRESSASLADMSSSSLSSAPPNAKLEEQEDAPEDDDDDDDDDAVRCVMPLQALQASPQSLGGAAGGGVRLGKEGRDREETAMRWSLADGA